MPQRALYRRWPAPPVAGGSFLLAIVCHVNGCKNIIGPVSPDRLPPLTTTAGGEGLGVLINLQRSLWEPRRRSWQQVDREQRDTWSKRSWLAYSQSSSLAAQRGEVAQNERMSNAGHLIRLINDNREHKYWCRSNQPTELTCDIWQMLVLLPAGYTCSEVYRWN